MIDVAQLTSELDRREDGVWVARHQRHLSYPAEGNDACFAVEDGSFWFRHRNQAILRLVETFSPAQVFFDIGGGNGCVAMALQAAGLETVLLEPGPAGARNARKRGLQTVLQTTLQDAGLAHGSIPAAGLFDVIEHIEDDAAFLRRVRDHLQPGGVLYVTVPAFPFLWSNDDRNAGHYRRYTLHSLSGLLNRCGFRVAWASYLFAFLVPSIFLFRSIPSRFGLRQTVSRERKKKEHAGGSGLVERVIQRLLQAELRRMARQKPIRFGGSCIAVAVKDG